MRCISTFVHLLHNIWQFIARHVGTRFIASAGVGRGLAFANAVVRTKLASRVINRVSTKDRFCPKLYGMLIL